MQYLHKRQYRAYVSVWGTTKMHLRNPVVVALWSAIFPGMGHILLNKYFTGFILFIWEFFINDLSNLNEGIFYTFTGQFEAAKSVLDTSWLLFYCPMYIFAIWDSYRTAVNINSVFVLTAKEDTSINAFAMNPLGINFLNKTAPWQSALWSCFTPGAGQLVNHQIIIGFFLFGWWVVVVYLSNLLPAIHYTMQGMFENSKYTLNIQWVLNIPSILCFCIYDAYVNAVENNKLFKWEQAKFLKKEYQNLDLSFMFNMQTDRSHYMYIVTTFEQNIKLETAITAIAMKGIPKESILAVPLEKESESRMLSNRAISSDSLSLFDLPMIFAALFSLLGLIYGFMLSWGPVLWALIGTGAGFGIGLVIKLISKKHQRVKQFARIPEVVLFIQCHEDQLQIVRDTLWANQALGVAKLDNT